MILWRPLASIQFSICYVCTSATTSIDTRKTCPALPAFGMYHFALFSVFGREIVANLPGVAYYTALTVSSTQSVSSNPFRGGILPLKRIPSKEENRAGFLEFPKVCELLAFERPLALRRSWVWPHNWIYLHRPVSQLYLYYYKDSLPVPPSTSFHLRQDCQRIGGCFIISVPTRPLNLEGYWPAIVHSEHVPITGYSSPRLSGGKISQVLTNFGTYDPDC